LSRGPHRGFLRVVDHTVAGPAAVQHVRVAIDALAIPAVLPFWRHRVPTAGG
jgi:hypothetical protein